MISLMSTSGLTVLLLLAVTTAVQASPINLFRRLEINYVDCSATRKAKLKTAFGDAAALADLAQDMDQSNTAFTHYLRPDSDDGVRAKSLWSYAAANNDPTIAPYTFSVRCAKKCTSDESNSLAITDSMPGKNDGSYPEMKICPLFFTAAVTKNRLDSKKYDKDGWCATGQKFKDFETGGHTLLHEMTHLDALAKAAGSPERDMITYKSHGTNDVDEFKEGDDYVTTARKLLEAWLDPDGGLAEGALQPFENAENIAAAATENWFIERCGFTDISL